MIRLVYILFILSGFIGLIYESLWARYLKLFLGHSSYGQIITLFIYMGGIGIGSFIGGSLCKRTRNPFMLYAAVECLIGLGGFMFHNVYLWTTGSFFSFSNAHAMSPLIVNSLKISLSLCITMPMAILLGMTFPALAIGVMRYTQDRGKGSLSWLYFTNSLGAAVGIMATSYLLIPKLGTFGSLLTAASANILIAAGFYLIARNADSVMSTNRYSISEEKTADSAVVSILSIRGQVLFWLIVSALTGLSSFIYEIGWIRLLSMLLGSSTHSFDIMVSAFILGLAFGGLYAKKILQRSKNSANTLALVQILMGAFALIGIYCYKYLFVVMNEYHVILQRSEPAYYLFAVFKYLVCVLFMCPTSFCAGMTLPVITYLAASATRNEKYIGFVYGWNTIGSIIGAVAGGLLLLPLLQLKNTIATGAVIDIVLGLVILYVFISSIRRRMVLSAVSVLIIRPVFFVHFNQLILTAGTFRNHINFDKIPAQKLVVRDGKTATISFHGDPANRSIRTNGKPDASISLNKENLRRSDEYTQAAVALYPLAILNHPYNAAIIGMGSGMTAHHLLTDPQLKKLDIVEIEKEVYNLSRNFLPYNRRAYEDPRVSRIVDDAKTYFSVNNKMYDVIISEPSNPWVSGVSSLFTMEFYTQISRHLAPEGILVQWMHLYEFNTDLLMTIVKAMDMTFPIIKIYQVPACSDIVLIASRRDFYFTNYLRIAENPGIKNSYPDHNNDPSLFGARNYLISNIGLKPLIKHFRPNSDFLPLVDNGAEKAFYLKSNVGVFNIFKQTSCPYREILEPEFFAKDSLNGPYRTWPYVLDSLNLAYLNYALKNTNEKSDWSVIEKLFFNTVPYPPNAIIWDGLESVQLYRKLVDAQLPPIKTRLQFIYSDNLIHGRQEQMIENIRQMVKEFTESEIIPFLVQSMLVTCIKNNEKELCDKVIDVFVKTNPNIDFYEKLLINEMASAM